MNEPTRDIDRSVERILAWRADRVAPDGLLDQINERLMMETQQRSSPVFGPVRVRSLAWLLVLVALLVAAAIGAASLAGSKPALKADTPSVAPSGAPAVVTGFGETICLSARSVPFDLANLALTGTWTDGGAEYYFRQLGNVLWIVGGGRLSGIGPAAQFDERAFTGTISGDTVRLDWAEVGALTPTETHTPPWENGSLTLRIQAGSDGNVELASVSQSGTRITGPGFAPFVFTPCTPETLSVRSAAP